MKYRISHVSRYVYSESVSLSHNEIYLTPRESPGQICHESSILVDPLPAVLSHRKDFFGNPFSFFNIEEHHSELVITAQSLVNVSPPLLPVLEKSPAWETVRDHCRSPRNGEELMATQFLWDSPFVKPDEALARYALPSFTGDRPILACLADLSARIFSDFTYDKAATTVFTPMQDFFRQRRGVCQDFAHLMIGCLRAVGLASRYVSGYLETQPLPGKERLIGADASHAWIAVFVPDLGWVDIDPTNNVFPSDRHITLGWGRDYGDVTPVKGVVLGGGGHEVKVSVDVAGVFE